jgi:TonB-linked SusC/RagA family outer membrane protein
MQLHVVSAVRCASVALALLVSAAAAQSQQGSILVTVTEQGSARPVEAAQVAVVGTNVGGLTNSEGRVLVRNVPSGTASVRVLRVGYAEQRKPVQVVAGQQATVEFALAQVAVSIAPVVTTATGQAAREELGNAVSTIDVRTVTETAPVSTVADVLNSRAPGVTVVTSSQTGSGSRVRIRGQSSLNLSNDPIYIIDGVRMTRNSNSSELFTGGTQPSRAADINPDEIENIEIVKGPSAATLYGTDAANGVVVITTKRGRAGPARWTAYVEGGLIADRNDYPTNYTIWGHTPGTTAGRACTLPQVSAGSCVRDSVRTLNIMNDDELTPIGMGNRYQFGAQVSGGTEVVRYFVSAEREGETGVFELPKFERRRFDSLGLPIPEWTERPNVLARNSIRANLSAAASSKLDLSVFLNFINIDQRFSLESNATAGIGSQVFGGPGYRENGVVGGGLGTPLNGYRAWTPAYTWEEKAGQQLNRYIGSLSANWRPRSWLETRMNFGNDFTDRVDDNLLLRGSGPPINNTYRLGFKFNTRADIRNVSADIASSASWQFRENILSRTTVGAQYVDYKLQFGEASGEDLPPGQQIPNNAAEPGSRESSTYSKTLGLFVEESVTLNDRLFVTAALRTDQNSAFGTEFQRVFYPKASVSWILSDEPFFPELGWMNYFRWRTAYGASGVQPGSNDALRTYGGEATNVRAVDVPAVRFDDIGNQDLRPERTTELEMGFEARFLNDRATVDVTHYRKRTKDALINAVIPPSYGSLATTVRRNLGAVRNLGWELLVNTQLVQREAVGFDLTVSASTNANKLLSLGGTPPQIGVTTRVVEGYPLFGFWERKIQGWEDKNGDGILTYNANAALNEVFVDSVASFIGYIQPRHNITTTGGLDLFKRMLRVQAMFDWRGGHYWYNNTERIRCVSRANCNGLQNPNATFEEQAMVVATRDHPTRTVAGFIQKGDFLRFREMSVSLRAPERWAAMMRASSAQFVLSARNLAVWSDYRGVDPETDRLAGESSDRPDEFQTFGPTSSLIFRVNLGF